jgi:hypothetical protein
MLVRSERSRSTWLQHLNLESLGTFACCARGRAHSTVFANWFFGFHIVSAIGVM